MDFLNTVNEVLKGRGYNIISVPFHSKIQEYMSFWRGSVNNFHVYNKFVRNRMVKAYRYGINISKMVSEDKRRLLFGEGIDIKTEKHQKILDAIFDENNYHAMLASLYEKSVAYAGYGFMIEYINGNKINIDFISAENCFPVKYNNKVISSIMTINRTYDKKNSYTLLTFFELDNGIFTIQHELYASKEEKSLGKKVPLNSIKEYENLTEKTSYFSSVPHFQIVTQNLINQYEPEAPYSLPVTAALADVYLSIDTIFDLMIREFNLKKPRIAITNKAIDEDIDSDGNMISYFNDDDVYQVLNMPGNEADPVKALDLGDFRTSSMIEGLNTSLKIASKISGLGSDFYGFSPEMQAVTATQVIASKSELFRNLQNERNLLEKSIKGTIKALEVLLNLSFGQITIKFDDSIIIDDEKEKENDLQLVEIGLMSKIKFLMTHKGLSKTEAIEWLKEIEEEQSLFKEESEVQQEVTSEIPIEIEESEQEIEEEV